ncbi:unnamed protein product, partial [Iphiclides podalirius]
MPVGLSRGSASKVKRRMFPSGIKDGCADGARPKRSRLWSLGGSDVFDIRGVAGRVPLGEVAMQRSQTHSNAISTRANAPKQTSGHLNDLMSLNFENVHSKIVSSCLLFLSEIGVFATPATAGGVRCRGPAGCQSKRAPVATNQLLREVRRSPARARHLITRRGRGERAV